jgi:glycosyltransferase involved in cell wall biosynthesis
MACGTPVLAFRCGSVPEVIEDGISGIVVDTMPEAIENIEVLLKLDRRKVRAAFERRFTAERMAKDYLSIYRDLPGVHAQAEPLPRVSEQPADLQVVA